MTSKEILQASLLEIVFDNRNKQYGAYALRKFYSNRLGIALAIAMSTAFLLCIFIKNATGYESLTVIKDPVVTVTDFILPKPAVVAPAKKLMASGTKTRTITNPVIVPDSKATNPLPSQGALDQDLLPNAGKEGGTGDPTPGNATGDGGGSSGDKRGDTNNQSTDFTPVSQAPEFPGGTAAWIAFLSKWLQVPEDMLAGERKTVLVNFQVGEDGNVTNFQVIRSAGRSFDNEVLRVLKRMPRWKPAIQNGHAVATSFSQPVTFQSSEN